MRAILQAITEELARLRADGEVTVPVSDGTLAALRAMVQARTAAAALANGGASSSVSAGTQGNSLGASVAVPAARPAFVNPLRAERNAAAAAAAPVVAFASAATAAKPVVLAPAPVIATKLPSPPAVTLPAGDKAARWAALVAVVQSDPVCAAQVGRGKKVTFCTGALDARIFFVGDAPGPEEEIAGEPFVGPEGQLLNRMLGGMGLKRDAVCVGNVLCWRPLMPALPGLESQEKRPPMADELAYCLPFLRAAMDIVQPELVVALGATAAQVLLGAKGVKLPEVRSRWHEFAGRPLMVTYHPGYLIQSDSKRSKRAVWEDLLKVMEKCELPISEKQRGYYL